MTGRYWAVMGNKPPVAGGIGPVRESEMAEYRVRVTEKVYSLLVAAAEESGASVSAYLSVMVPAWVMGGVKVQARVAAKTKAAPEAPVGRPIRPMPEHPVSDEEYMLDAQGWVRMSSPLYLVRDYLWDTKDMTERGERRAWLERRLGREQYTWDEWEMFYLTYRDEAANDLKRSAGVTPEQSAARFAQSARESAAQNR